MVYLYIITTQQGIGMFSLHQLTSIKKIATQAAVAISILIISLIFASPSYALSESSLDTILREQQKQSTSIIPPSVKGESSFHNLPANKKSGTMTTQSLESRTYVDPVTTSIKSPILYGYVPAWCDDVAVVVFPDTADIDSGTGMYAFFSEQGQIYLEQDVMSEYDGYWSLDLQANGLGLQNGKYNVYVSSKCDYGDYSDPLYSDLFFDTISIQPSACTTACTPVHRFYNTQNGAHFYTSSDNEKRNIIYNMTQYSYEGIANFANHVQESSTIPVHRFYHKMNGTHFYTSNQNEATVVNNTQSHTYRYEGIAYYSYKNNIPNTNAVHRFYKFRQGVHFYTSNQSEASNVNENQSHTYRYEGVSYYNIINN